MKISEDRIRGYKYFANKIWNVTRFIMEQNPTGTTVEYTENDTLIRDELTALLREVTSDMEEFRFYLAAEKLYHYLWHTFADKVIEESKLILKENEGAAVTRRELLHEMLELQLKALHPFIPFVTEAAWHEMHPTSEPLMIAEWPYHAV